ncbi:unnamed protein product [Rotaria sordida]|uniref:PGAP2IP C-terminal nuclease-like domain-containing protein n=1 Tax=Rotaria sordida TaxID=392033 RepID=A0A819Z2V5_9BILA|nr:unnamed protein product [Rotaria sordida]
MLLPTYLTAAVWTVHFGYDNNARPSLDRVASVLADTNADVIALLERDTAKPFFRNNYLTSYLGEKVTYVYRFWSINKRSYVRVHYLLPSPEAELPPAILGTIQTARKLIYIIIVHMGNERDDLDRKLQEIKKIFIFYFSTNPLVFLGYITSERFSRDYRRLTSVAKDIDPTDKNRWCQYILYNKFNSVTFHIFYLNFYYEEKIHFSIGYARITHSSLTDREIEMATFKIRTSEKFDDHSILVTDPSVVTEQSVLFNSN